MRRLDVHSHIVPFPESKITALRNNLTKLVNTNLNFLEAVINIKKPFRIKTKKYMCYTLIRIRN